tara:strand:+ start:6135 stop:7364 length:1230 start_codon:yes stop_codon:yes gene_type:complete
VSNYNIEKRGDGFIRAGHADALINKKVRDSIPPRDLEYGTSGIKSNRVSGENQPVDNLEEIIELEAGGGTTSALPISQHFLAIPDSSEKVPLFHVGDTSYYGNPISIYNTPNTGQLSLTANERADFKIRSVDSKPGDVIVQGRYGHAIKLSQDIDERPHVLITNGFHTRPGFEKFIDAKRAASDKRIRIGYSSDMNVNGSSLYMTRGTFPTDFKLGQEVELRKEGSKTADAIKDLYENRIMAEGKELYMKPSSNRVGLQPKFTDNNMLLASENIHIHTPNFKKNGEIKMLSSGHMNLTSFSNIKLTVANPDELKATDRDIGRIYLGDPFSINPAVKGNEYTDTIMEIISLMNGLTNAVKSLSGKGEAGTAEVSFKHLESALEVITTSLSKLKTKVGTGKKDLSRSVFVQ